MAQPSDLPPRKLNPDAEAQVAEATAEAAEVSESPTSEAEAVPQEELSEEEEVDSIVQEALQARSQGGGAEDPSIEDIVNEAADGYIEGEAKYIEDNNLSGEIEDDPFKEEEESPLDGMQQVAIRAAAGMALNEEQEQRIVQRLFGNDFKVFRARDGRIKFQKVGSKKSFFIDKEAFKGGFTEIMADIFLDNSGLFVEMITGMATETAAIAGGARIGLLAGPAGVAAGATAGAIAGIPAGVATSQAVRSQILQSLGETFEDSDQSERFLQDTALNLATLGMGTLLLKGAKSIAGGIRRTMDASPKQTVSSLAKIRQGFEQFKRQFGSGLSKTKAEAGTEVNDAVVRISDDMGRTLGNIRTEFSIKTGGNPLPVEKYIGTLKKTLKDKVKMAPDDIEAIAGMQKGTVTERLMRKDLIKKVEESSLLGGGSDAVDFVDDVIDQLQVASAKGGLTAEDIANKLKFWKTPSGISPRTKAPKRRPSEANALAGRIRGSLTGDEITAYEKAFADDASKIPLLKDMKREYFDKIDAIEEFKKIFQSKKRAEAFTESIINESTKKTGRGIVELRDILGPHSDEFQTIRGVWMDDLFKKATNNRFGIVDPRIIDNALDKLGDESVNALLTKGQQKTLRFISRKSKDIPGMNLGVAKDARAVEDFAAVVVLNYQNPKVISKVLWNLFGSNTDIAEELANGGIQKIVSRPGIRKRISESQAFEIIQSFKASVEKSKRVMMGLPSKRGGKVLDLIDDSELDGKVGQEFLEAVNIGVRRGADIPTPGVPTGRVATGEVVEEVLSGEE